MNQGEMWLNNKQMNNSANGQFDDGTREKVAQWTDY